MATTRHTAEFIVGVDFGQQRDFSACSILERVRFEHDGEMVQEGFAPPRLRPAAPTFEYHLVHLERLPLGTRYPAVVSHLVDIMAALPPAERAPSLVVDGTGVGRPVVDMLVLAGLRPVAVTITGGATENQPHTRDWRVPKKNLVGALVVLFQTGKLQIAHDLTERQTFVSELTGFTARISAAGHESFEAALERLHDDMVCATALAAWWGELPRPLFNLSIDRFSSFRKEI
jgi:hypothetical protein